MLAQEAEVAADGEEAAPGAKRRKTEQGAVNPMADDRFKAMFEDEAFTIDEESTEYKVLHPNAGKVRGWRKIVFWWHKPKRTSF